jgi:hypothetical protein
MAESNVIVIGGAPFAAKTTLAKQLAAQRGYVLVAVDDLGAAMRAWNGSRRGLGTKNLTRGRLSRRGQSYLPSGGAVGPSPTPTPACGVIAAVKNSGGTPT